MDNISDSKSCADTQQKEKDITPETTTKKMHIKFCYFLKLCAYY